MQRTGTDELAQDWEVSGPTAPRTEEGSVGAAERVLLQNAILGQSPPNGCVISQALQLWRRGKSRPLLGALRQVSQKGRGTPMTFARRHWLPWESCRLSTPNCGEVQSSQGTSAPREPRQRQEDCAGHLPGHLPGEAPTVALATNPAVAWRAEEAPMQSPRPTSFRSDASMAVSSTLYPGTVSSSVGGEVLSERAMSSLP